MGLRGAGARQAALLLLLPSLDATGILAAEKAFQAGAFALELNPRKLPVIVNAMFTERSADRVHDSLHARCLVLDDGSLRVALAVVDSCMLPRDLIERVKERTERATGIPAARILVSATHTHSAPSAMGCLGSRPDPDYQRQLEEEVPRGIEAALKNLAPARVGWTVVRAPRHTFCRRWIFRSDRVGTDPFGRPSIRANMHPGHQNPDAIGPSGPVDPDLSLLSLETPDGRPLALLANFSMHYYGSPLLSADYFGSFAGEVGRLLGAAGPPGPGRPAFVGIMTQGTSGDLMWMDYGAPRSEVGYQAYARELAEIAHRACRGIEHRPAAALAMEEARLRLRYRVPDPERLAWARKVVEGLGDRQPQSLPEIYAREQLFLHERQETELVLQALRVGDLGIAAIPNEVFGITGLKIKAASPLPQTFIIELANGAEGYLPPPEQHLLGGYTTWPARTAGLEVEAEPRIVEAVLGLLEKLSSRPRRDFTESQGPAAQAVLARKPRAYFRLGELAGPRAHDSSGNGRHGTYRGAVALGLSGPGEPEFSSAEPNRCPHFAGGRIEADLPRLGERFTVEMWCWNGLPADSRGVTGYLLSRGGCAAGASVEHLGIGGKDGPPGRLFFSAGGASGRLLSGSTELPLKTWRRLKLVRDGRRVEVYLDGAERPEISGEAEPLTGDAAEVLTIGGCGCGADFEGKIDEVVVE